EYTSPAIAEMSSPKGCRSSHVRVDPAANTGDAVDRLRHLPGPDSGHVGMTGGSAGCTTRSSAPSLRLRCLLRCRRAAPRRVCHRFLSRASRSPEAFGRRVLLSLTLTLLSADQLLALLGDDKLARKSGKASRWRACTTTHCCPAPASRSPASSTCGW